MDSKIIMNKEAALEKYSSAMASLQAHLAANDTVFKAHQELVMRVMDAENALRDAVAEAGEGCSNGKFTVTCTPQTMRVYNEEKMHQYMSSSQFADSISDVSRPPRITIKEHK